MQISVISLFRNSERYMHRTFENLEALERRYDVTYFFYENDSADNTPRRLREWMRGRPGLVIAETLGAKAFAQTTEPERLSAMAQYRNRILAEALHVRSDWTLLLDSDVEFTGDLIEAYLALSGSTAVMFTPFVEHNVRCFMCDPPCRRAAYYDSFALRDAKDRRGQVYSCNPFWDEADRSAWSNGEPVEVHCAFGGAALIRSDVLEKCHWQSDGDCEHVAFAEQVREHGSILAVPQVKTWTTTSENAPKPEILQMQRQLLHNPLLLRFWTARNWGNGDGQETHAASS